MTVNHGGTVLIVTTTIDLSADRVLDRLVARGVPVFRLNTDRLPYEAEIAASYSPRIGGTFQFREAARIVHSDAIVAYWYRRVRMPPRPADVVDESHEYVFREANAVLRGVLDILGTRNRSFGSPVTLERAESKVLQLEIAATLGFETPPTIITASADEMRGFAAELAHAVIAKPVHSGYVRLPAGEVGIFTERLSAADLDNVESALPCPIILQAEIPKAFDIRATVVRDKVFAAAIDSQSDAAAEVDWRRTSRPDLPHRRHDLPSDVRAMCIAVAQRLGTGFAAIDLVLTRDGRYVFLEANPNGEWLWIEDALEYPISDAIGAYLADGE